MSNPLRFSYKSRSSTNGPLDQVPMLPFNLECNGVSLALEGMVDSGALFSILPFDVGQHFGMSWDRQPNAVRLGGIAQAVAKVVPFAVRITGLPPIQLSFAWARSNAYPVLLGNADFFFHFDVFLCRRRSYFEIQPATP